MSDPGVLVAFLGGLLALLGPCSALLLPAFFAYSFTSRTRLLGRTALFYAGLCLTLCRWEWSVPSPDGSSTDTGTSW